MKKITIPVFRYGTGADLPLPAYATEESAGMDLYAAIPGAITIPPRGREKYRRASVSPCRPGLKRKSAAGRGWPGKKALLS